MRQLDPAFGWSVAKPGQPHDRNADHFSTLIHPDHSHAALHVVCDGISAAQLGRAAARAACDRSIQRFRDYWTAEVVDADFLRDTLTDAHEFVRRTVGTNKAHCAIVAVLVNLESAKLTVGHAGDSVAYHFDGQQLVRLTEDHVEAEVQTENGKPILVNSSPVIVRALVRYIGQSGTFDPEIVSHACQTGSWICLASDGVVPASIQRFFSDIAVNATQDSIADFCLACSVETNDDATVVIQQLGKRPDVANLEDKLRIYVKLDAQERDRLIATIGLKRDVNPDLVFACIELETDEARAGKLLAVISRDAKRIRKEQWIRFLDTACERKWRRIANELVVMIRKL